MKTAKSSFFFQLPTNQNKILKPMCIFLVSIFIFSAFCQPAEAFWFFKKKKKNIETKNINKEGYYGDLPDLNENMEKLKQSEMINIPPSKKEELIEEKLLDAPLDDEQYLNMILKKQKKSDFVIDIMDIRPILEKLQICIEKNGSLQHFNAISNNLANQIDYILNRHKEKIESSYEVYNQLKKLNAQTKQLMQLRKEALMYSKFLTYEGEGAKYKPEIIKQRLQHFNSEIRKTIDLIDKLI